MDERIVRNLEMEQFGCYDEWVKMEIHSNTEIAAGSSLSPDSPTIRVEPDDIEMNNKVYKPPLEEEFQG